MTPRGWRRGGTSPMPPSPRARSSWPPANSAITSGALAVTGWRGGESAVGLAFVLGLVVGAAVTVGWLVWGPW